MIREPGVSENRLSQLIFLVTGRDKTLCVFGRFDACFSSHPCFGENQVSCNNCLLIVGHWYCVCVCSGTSSFSEGALLMFYVYENSFNSL